jgi:photosystem II stability/assembly factor-like uncharacterized protein
MRAYLLTFFLVLNSALHSQTQPWTRLNPFPQGQTIRDIKRVPGTNRLVAACSSSTILISDNIGETWQTILYPGGMPVDLEPRGLHFINDHVGFMFDSKSRLFKTTDAGLTWQLIFSPANYNYNGFFDIAFASDSIGFVTGHEGLLLQTTDQGETWNEMQTDADNVGHIEFRNQNEGYITSGENNILVTTDGGFLWTIQPNPSGIPADCRILDICFVSSSTAIACALNNYNKFYKTTNGGTSWYEIYSDSNYNFVSNLEFADSLHGVAYRYASYYSPARLLVTSNGGVTWDSITQVAEDGFTFNTFEFYNQNIVFTGGSAGRMWKSENSGYNWQKFSQHKLDGMIKDVIIFDEYNAVLNESGSGVSVLKTSDGFLSFDTLLNLPYDYLTIDFPDADTGYCVTFMDDYIMLIFRTFNGGNNWICDTIDMSANPTDFPTPDIDFYNSKKGIIKFVERIYLTSDAGTTWEEKFIADSVFLENTQYISETRIAVSGWHNRVASLFLSEDGGETWYDFPTPETNYCGRVHFINEMTGFLLYSPNLYKSTDGGYTWLPCLITGNQYLRLNNMSFPSADTGYIVGLADFENVLKSTDAGQTWFSIHAPVASRLDFIGFSDNDTGYVFNSFDIFKTTTGGIVSTKSPKPSEQGFKAYPNPFRDGIQIDVLRKDIRGTYEMNVFNAYGRKVHSSNIQPYTSSIIFRGSELTPGVYFLQFINQNKVIGTIKVVKE